MHGSVARDPRGHSLSIVTAALLGSRCATTGTWTAADDIGELAFDHARIIADARSWCARHVWSDPLVFAGLLPDSPASTGEIVAVVGALAGATLDTSNIRRRIAASGMFVDTGERRSTGVGHPGRAWRLRSDP